MEMEIFDRLERLEYFARITMAAFCIIKVITLFSFLLDYHNDLNHHNSIYIPYIMKMLKTSHS